MTPDALKPPADRIVSDAALARLARQYPADGTPATLFEDGEPTPPAAAPVRLTLNPASVEDYRTFLAVKRLPAYRVTGRTVTFPAEYAHLIGVAAGGAGGGPEYRPSDFLFDYQAGVARLAVRKRKFAAFVRCGLGKTNVFLEFARHAQASIGRRRTLIVSPAMVIDQTLAEAAKFYGMTLPIEPVAAKDLPAWLAGGGAGRIGVCSYNALDDEIAPGNLGALILDESSMLKSTAGGAWANACVRLGRGLAWKLALTGTPAPNDRIEFANHAVLMDAFPTVNAFLARFFVNRGQTDNRWEMKAHATAPFYRALSHWSIFLNNPATYGWRDNAGTIPPIRVHVEDVALTAEQQRMAQDATGMLIAGAGGMGGIGKRSKMSQLAKGKFDGRQIESLKPEYIRGRIASWPTESTIVWCRYNDEQDRMADALPGAASIDGGTPHAKRMAIIEDFKAGRIKTLLSKPEVLGFGLNLQVATRHVFSGLEDSYEKYHQCVCRSNRVGSTKPLDVHIPVTAIERPMIETVLAKADRVDADNAEQERIFKESANEFLTAA